MPWIRATSKLSLALALAVVGAATGQGMSAQRPPVAGEVQWDASVVVQASEREQVLALARQVGVDRPARVLAVAAPGRDRCPSILVQSARTRFLHEVSWSEVELSREAVEEGCVLGALMAGAPRVGRFATWDRAEPRVHWLVEDGSWSLELTPQPAVSFEIAEQIVLAFHRGTVIDQRNASSASQAPSVAAIADQIEAISAFPSQYTVHMRLVTGGGWMASVLLDDGKVVLFSLLRVRV